MDSYINYSELLKRTMNDAEIALEILECYIEETKKSITYLGNAIKNINFSEAREKAHEIKGSSSSASAENMFVIAKDMQIASEDKNLEKLNILYLELEQTFNKTCIHIGDLLKNDNSNS